MKKPEAWTDEEMLLALDMRAGGSSSAAIGQRLGRTRASVCGVLKRIDDDCRKAEGA